MSLGARAVPAGKQGCASTDVFATATPCTPLVRSVASMQEAAGHHIADADKAMSDQQAEISNLKAEKQCSDLR
jgi:hypothetical protein